ncbi:MAG: hypothetical protein ACK4MQ_03315 [Hyphomonas sp.]
MFNNPGLVMRSVLAIAFISTLGSCGDMDIPRFGQNTDPAVGQTADLETSAADPITDPAAIFDGTRSVIASLPSPLTEFAVSVRLKPTGPAPSPAVFADTTPPQPFRFTSTEGAHVVATHVGEALQIGSVSLINFREFTSILLVAQGEQPMKVYRDNQYVGETDPIRPVRNFYMGRSFKERYWSGQIEEFRVFDLTGATIPVEPGNISNYPVVYDLHGED